MLSGSSGPGILVKVVHHAKLGQDLLGRINALRSELAGHPARAEVLAYLQLEDQ